MQEQLRHLTEVVVGRGDVSKELGEMKQKLERLTELMMSQSGKNKKTPTKPPNTPPQDGPCMDAEKVRSCQSVNDLEKFGFVLKVSSLLHLDFCLSYSY